MERSQRPEIDNGHVPLAFLLGRHASDYRLPTLAARPSRRAEPVLAAPLLSDETAHIRHREALARQLLERVLAGESRLDTNQKYEPETPLEAPMAPVSTADRRRRVVELQRVLKEREVVAAAVAAAESAERSESTSFTDLGSGDTRLYEQRELFAATHGYVPRERDFVEVVGSTARIQRAQSVRQFHEDEKLKSTKLFKAKRSRRAVMTQQLHAQQANMRAKLVEVERSMARMGPLHDDEDDETRAVQPNRTVGNDAIRQKQIAVKQWQDEQHRQLERTREDERQQLLHRQEFTRRARKSAECAVKARATASQFEKNTMAKIKGVGPSFQSALRVESPDSLHSACSAPSLLLDVVTGGQHHSEEEKERAYRRGVDGELLVGSDLCARQYELFLKSQPRSLHLGGGFASKPRDTSSTHAGNDGHDMEHGDLSACAIPLTKSKRQVQDEWRQTLVAYP